MKNEINFKDNSEISRIFSQGNGAKYFEDKFYEKFNGSPKENDKINNFAYTFTWNPRATHTTNPAEQLVGSWQGGEATVKGNNVYFRIHNTIGANSLFFGRQLGEHGITPVGQTKNDIHMTIEWTIPLRKVLK